MADSYGNTTTSAGTLSIGEHITSAIEEPFDQDWFKVELVAGETYRFELSGSAAGAAAQHPSLKVLAPNVGTLGPTSREGSQANPIYAHTALTSGTHYLAVSNADETGTYTLGASLYPYPRHFIGGSADDDRLATTGAIDVIAGGSGLDTVTINGSFSDYRVTGSGSNIAVDFNGQQSDYLFDVERLQFNDRSLAFDLHFDGNAARVVRTMGVMFESAAPDTSGYIGNSLALLDQGMSFEDFVQHNLDAVLGPNATSAEIVTLMYRNVAQRDPPAQAMEFYTGLLDTGAFTPGQLGVFAANTPENYINNYIRYVGIRPSWVEFTDYPVIA